MVKSKRRDRYDYEGPVMKFDICIDRNWKATTWAPSEKKALSNLTFRYKRDHDMVGSVNITLPGKIKKID